ncbi:MAG: acetyltransferase [Bacteroidia bacterium]|nr:acetyltransferase [Bacteroidia bacterium]MCZ2356637.1 acetyltransferase [Bacteroidia bacterium]
MKGGVLFLGYIRSATSSALTKRAADGGDSAASRDIFHALSFFSSLDSPTPAPRPPLTQTVRRWKLMVKKQKIVVIGSSGHAKVAIDVIEKEGKFSIVGLIDSFKKAGQEVFNYQILGTEEDLPILSKKYNLFGSFIAIGDNWQRHLMAKKIEKISPTLNFVSTFHPSVQLARGAIIGKGTIATAESVVNSDCEIGTFCIINTKASLDHDCIMGNFSSLAPNATTGGNVKIDAFSSISLGANIIHNRNIGKHTVIGAGSVVLNDIPDYCVAYGTPAKVIRTRQEGDKYL